MLRKRTEGCLLLLYDNQSLIWMRYESKEGIIMNQVKIAKGIVEGIQKDGYSLFLGIPYAKPPVGELRWRPPQEPEAWGGVYCADRYPNRSMQEEHPDPFYGKEFYDDLSRETPYSEDSLYLNIWTPAKVTGKSCRLQCGSMAAPSWADTDMRRSLTARPIAAVV